MVRGNRPRLFCARLNAIDVNAEPCRHSIKPSLQRMVSPGTEEGPGNMSILEKEGTVVFDRAVDSRVLPGHLADCLRKIRASEVRVQGDQVMFEGGIFRFVTSWNVLYSFGSGNLSIDSPNLVVQYRLSFSQMGCVAALVWLVASLILVGFPAFAWLILVLPFLCLFMLISSVAVGELRFQNFLRRSVAAVPRQQQHS
jgi:hypothetical protein